MTTETASERGSTGAVLLRVTLGVIILVTWFDNLDKGLYTADGLTGFLEWLFDAQSGNGSTLTVYKSFLDVAVIPVAGLYGGLQLVVEFLFGIGLLVGGLTRLSSLVAAAFFFNVFLSYYGGNEWIWTYVLLVITAIAVFVGYGGRKLGLDQWLARSRGESPFGLLW
ncbi:MAG TPA: hypothetical protein ENH15_03395 [Actinobacteria bacterium]|nr:hypothetical protein [Actinomycetota bacterium]